MVWRWARKRSIWVYHFNSGGCNGCDIELISCFSPRYDLERFGVKWVASPRHADVLIVTGAITKKAEKMLRKIYEQIPEPKRVIALGNCAISGGPFQESENIIKGVDEVIPVDVKVVGCPPRPDAIIKAILEVFDDESKRNSKENEE